MEKPSAGRAFSLARRRIGSGAVRSHQGLRDHDMAEKRDGDERRDERGDQDLKHGLPPNAGTLIRRTGIAARFTPVQTNPANPLALLEKTQLVQLFTS